MLLNLVNCKSSIRMILWQTKNLVFSNDVSVAYVVVHFQDIYRGRRPVQFVAREAEALGPPIFHTTKRKS